MSWMKRHNHFTNFYQNLFGAPEIIEELIGITTVMRGDPSLQLYVVDTTCFQHLRFASYYLYKVCSPSFFPVVFLLFKNM